MTKTSRILLMAGGTGGHIIPALAVAQYLQQQGAEVHWLGNKNGLEYQLVTPHGIIFHDISVAGLRGKGVWGAITGLGKMVKAIYQAWRILRAVRPERVGGFGGFVSAPGGVAAWLLRIPFIIQEQNAVAGFTNRGLAHLATRVYQAFPETFPARLKPITSGNPVRTSIAELPVPALRFAERPCCRLLILGGSQGAAIFNQKLPTMLSKLVPHPSLDIWHSAGKNQVEQTRQSYMAVGMTDVNVVDFIDDMAAAYAWADLVICRAGALTLAELTAAGVGSILIPYPYAVDDHQTKNATWLVKAHAALLIPQAQLTEEKLIMELSRLLSQRTQLLNMAEAARSLALPNATRQVAEGLL
ncbi:MAG: undecaprenyldiphospho-muramoylpentapeptide beta-N-acetylglucosaminyltransferase [Gammaproteobacteria bacterium]